MKQALAVAAIIGLSTLLAACGNSAGHNHQHNANAKSNAQNDARNDGSQPNRERDAAADALKALRGQTLQYNPDLESRIRSIDGARNANLMLAGDAAFVMLDDRSAIGHPNNPGALAGTAPRTGWSSSTGFDTTGLGIAGGTTSGMDPQSSVRGAGDNGDVNVPPSDAPSRVTEAIKREYPTIRNVYFISYTR
jgi:predicted small secreted protein